jgi:hypothetical protein
MPAPAIGARRMPLVSPSRRQNITQTGFPGDEMHQQPFQLRVCDAFSHPGGPVNADVVGHAGNVAWVIDGATDIGDGPLVDAHSDAAWFAAKVGDWLSDRACALPAHLDDLVTNLAEHVAQDFTRLSRRPPADRCEHPSAAGLIVRIEGRALEYLALGDCSLLVAGPDGSFHRFGVQDEDAGDAHLSDHLSRPAPLAGETEDPSEMRARLLPVLRSQRTRMNLVPGYGVFSITAPPPEYVNCDRIPLAEGTRILIASDGLMRLVDVFRAWTPADLLAATFERGVAAMTEELRRLEASDTACRSHPRAKTSDDATALLATIMPCD